MRYASVSELETQGIQLKDLLSISISVADVAHHLDRSTEDIIRDGLGTFRVVTFFSEKVGFWALAGPEAHPQEGASVWAQPEISTHDLAREVRQAIGGLRPQLMNTATGERLDQE